MYTYITYGTEFFLKQIKEKNLNRDINLFYSDGNSYLYEETDKKSIFASPQKYEVLKSIGQISETPTLIQYFVIKEARQKVYDGQVVNDDIAQYEGFKAFRLLKPLQGETYAAVFQFEKKQQLEDIKKSSFFRNNYSPEAVSQYHTEDFMANMYHSKHLIPYED